MTEEFNLGDYVRKKSGSQWRGKVVGFYRTDLNDRGIAVESYYEKGSVQIYPAQALERWAPDVSSYSHEALQLVKAARSAFDALKRHIPDAHGVHPNPEYQIVEDMAAALVPFKEVE